MHGWMVERREGGKGERERVNCYNGHLVDNLIKIFSGDSLGNYPRNHLKDVIALLNATKFSGEQKVQSAKWAFNPKPVSMAISLIS